MVVRDPSLLFHQLFQSGVSCHIVTVDLAKVVDVILDLGNRSTSSSTETCCDVKGKGKNKKNKKWADIGVKFRAKDSEKWKTDALVFSNSSTPSSVGSAHDKNPYLGSITKNANTDWEFGFGDEGR